MTIKERIAASRARLEDSGGRRIIVDLEADAAQALQAIIDRDGLGDKRNAIKLATSAALLAHAKRKPRA